MSDKKYRAWAFTWNNYSDENLGWLDVVECEYICYGKEVAPETGTPHLQGWIKFKNPRTFGGVRKKVFFEKAHVEPVKSEAAIEIYCRKDGDIYERGTKPKQGARSDLEAMKEHMQGGGDIGDLWEMNFNAMLQYRRGFEAYRNNLLKDRTDPPKVAWLWGGTGVGKTSYAFNHHEKIYIKDGTMWWDGYQQQEAIVIDDFDGKWPYRDFLRLLDRYPYQGQIKGGYTKINSGYIYITCEYPPSHFWTGSELAQVVRRLVTIRELKIHDGPQIIFAEHGTEVPPCNTSAGGTDDDEDGGNDGN